MTVGEKLISPNHAFNQPMLKRALKSLGDYVYGYYRPTEIEPFYVGKGKEDRVLHHWTDLFKGNLKYNQCKEIRRIIKLGKAPDIKILAYDLQSVVGDKVSGVVERVLQNTFGIERNVNENVFKSRVNQSSTLVQHRNDGSKYPVLSLESAYCKGGFDDANIIVPSELAFESPVLLVGLSRSYRTAYTQADLCEMARMYWKLDKFKNTTLPALLQSEAAVLAGWTSEFGGPQIMGIWRITKGSFKRGGKESIRYKCEVKTDFPLRKKFLGSRLSGVGHSYEGPHIYLPNGSGQPK